MRLVRWFEKRLWLKLTVLTILVFWWFSLPRPLFAEPYCTVLEDEQGQLLGARIAPDGQWRFPPGDSVPFKFATAIRYFEDERFNYHLGVDPLALARAIRQNIKQGEVVSGASTISMQVIRLASGNPDRTYGQKLWEMFRATRLEAGYSKDEILQFYCDNAPFGGNVVGLEAASWRYFGLEPHRLSWAEAASLAVLPNAPSVILPGRNEQLFKAKRDRLLGELHSNGVIDSTTYRISLLEPLPGKPIALPAVAKHALEEQVKNYPSVRIKSTLDGPLQRKVQSHVDNHVKSWKANMVYNAAAIVVEVATGEVKAYVGNTSDASVDGSGYNMLEVRRSTGSILKPILYSNAIDAGLVTPYSLLPDIPTRFGNFTPKNFDKSFRGAVSLKTALQLSLNVPPARLLKQYKLPRFYNNLKQLGLSDLDQQANFYGLSLILGGAEVRPVQFTKAFYTWVQRLNPDVAPVLHDLFGEPMSMGTSDAHPVTVFQTLEMMKGVNRPARWQNWQKGRPVAWKTGTSYGFKDAWAVGTDGEWMVVTWIGNANQEGRPGLIGGYSAAPLFFNIFNELASTHPYEVPWEEGQQVSVCKASGYGAGSYCAETESIQVGQVAPEICDFCIPIQLNTDGQRVHQDCAIGFHDTSWMQLPPSMQWYYAHSGGIYPPVPEWASGCDQVAEGMVMEWIYPEQPETVKRSVDFDGELGGIVLEVGHREETSTVYWYANDQYIGQTTGHHQIEVALAPGEYTLTALDGDGLSIKMPITVMGASTID